MNPGLKMTKDEMQTFLGQAFPQLGPGGILIDEVGADHVIMRLRYHERHLRPGGTISGPSMFALADVGLYVAILAQIGLVTGVVTTQLSINFLRRPGQSDLLADCRVLKLGKRLAVGQASLYSVGDEDTPVAHAVGSYSIPDEAKS